MENIWLTDWFASLGNAAWDDEDTISSETQTSCSWTPLIRWRQTKASPKTKWAIRYISIFGSLSVYLLALWGFINIVQQLLVVNRHHIKAMIAQGQWIEGCDCGESVAEAISLGCKFDALSMAWLPEHCRDDELTAEFDMTGKGKELFRDVLKHRLIILSRSKWNLDLLRGHCAHNRTGRR
jgi:hypothetical protein